MQKIDLCKKNRRCDNAIHLVNVATGGCLSRKGSVSEECSDGTFWEYLDDATLRVTGDNSSTGFARLMKRTPGLEIVGEVKYKTTCAGQSCEGSVPQDWFRWDIGEEPEEPCKPWKPCKP